MTLFFGLKMNTILKKNQKPIEYDIHLKYRCPNSNCEQIHWLSLLEAKTKNFKVVCDCGCVFKPKQIDNIKLLYTKASNKIKEKKTDNHTIDKHLLLKTTQILIGYGFTQQEANDLIVKTYNKSPTTDCGTLVKNCLIFLGENSNE